MLLLSSDDVDTCTNSVGLGQTCEGELGRGGVSGYFALVGGVILLILALLLAVFRLIMTVAQAAPGIILMVLAIVVFIAAIFMFKGCTSVAPGNAVILQLDGKYVGTVRQ